MYPRGEIANPDEISLQMEGGASQMPPSDDRVAQVGGTDVNVYLSPNGHDLTVGLSWDFVEGNSPVDLDCSVVCCNAGGQVLDACYFNQQICMAGAIMHSGDNKTGVGAGFDESVQIDIDLVHPGVSILVFVLNAFKGGNLSSVANAKVTVLEVGKPEPLAVCPVTMRKGDFTGMVLGFLYKPPGVEDNHAWKFRNLGRACQGRNFEESLPDVRRALNISGILDPASTNMIMSMDKKFNMSKGDFLEIPQHLFQDGSDLFIGLGWETPGVRGGVDLDASVLLFDAQNNLIDVVNYANLSFLQGAVRHNGDNVTGAGKGDDEKIDLDLDRLPPVVAQMYVVVNVYSSRHSFQHVSDAYVRLCAAKNKHEFCRFCLQKQTVLASCLIFARIFRGPVRGSWVFNTIGVGCHGNVATQPSVVQGCLASVNGFGGTVSQVGPSMMKNVQLFQPVQVGGGGPGAAIVQQPMNANGVAGGGGMKGKRLLSTALWWRLLCHFVKLQFARAKNQKQIES
ncbi:unnamed protein product [Amoebophrya sp. A120]|nr:unnamed protein product [Amoebophrya sp. A120]|eukprot:GSA120T00010744001.1